MPPKTSIAQRIILIVGAGGIAAMVLLPPWQNGRSDENREFFPPAWVCADFQPPPVDPSLSSPMRKMPKASSGCILKVPRKHGCLKRNVRFGRFQTYPGLFRSTRRDSPLKSSAPRSSPACLPMRRDRSRDEAADKRTEFWTFASLFSWSNSCGPNTSQFLA